MHLSNNIQKEKNKHQQQQDVFLNKKIVAPEKLKILVLSGNNLVNDELEFLQKCVSLIKLDLSNNHITMISNKIKMNHLKKLKMLNLQNNKITKLQGLEGIFCIPELVSLTIRDNPIERLPRIEHLIVNMIPSLKVLGDRIIFVEERSQDLTWSRKSINIQPEMIEGWKTSQNDESEYIRILEIQIKYFDNVWEFNNPIIRIQRYWKAAYKKKIKEKFSQKSEKMASKKNLKEQKSANFMLKQYFQSWRQTTQCKRAVYMALQNTKAYPHDKTYLTYSLNEYQRNLRNFRLNSVVLQFLKRVRQKIFLRKMAEKLKRNLKKKVIEFQGPQSFCAMMKQRKFYFAKTQRHLLDNFLIHIGENFNWRQKVYNSVKIQPSQQYLTIRLLDTEAFSLKTVTSTLTYLIWPSMRAIFLKKKKYAYKKRTGYIKIRPLTYIKNKYKVLTKQQYKKSVKMYKKLQKFAEKQYQNSIDCFQCGNEEIFKMLIRYIFYHNTKTKKFEKKTQKDEMASLLESYDEPFIFYTDDVLKRSSAAVRIQQNWRKYLNNKKQKQSIFEKMKKTRAILKIQRFFRDRIFYHRVTFQKQIPSQLKLFNTSSFYLHQAIYKRILTMTSQEKKISLYPGMKVYEQIKNKKRSFGLKWEMEKSAIPPDLREYIFHDHEHQQEILYEKAVDFYSVLHVGSMVSQISYKNHNYLEFTFDNVSEARLRIYILALMSYRLWDSKYIIPLSKDTLNFEELRLSEYEKFIPQIKNKKENNFVNDENKIMKYSQIDLKGFFLFNRDFPYDVNNISTVNLQFYQKRARDYPQKYMIKLNYFVPFYVVEQMRLEDEELINEVIQRNIVQENFQKKRKQLQTPQSDVSMNVSKIDSKRLSFHDFGYKTGAFIRYSKKNQQIKKKVENQTAELEKRDIERVNQKQKISRIKESEMNKKSQIMQKKKNQLQKLREKAHQEKNLNQSLKNMKELERAVEMKKKVQKIKRFKSRASSQKHQQEHDDFIQQGNFVMEQQLKMVVLKSKMKSQEMKKKQKISSATTAIQSKRRSSFSYSRNLYTQQRKEDVSSASLHNSMSKNLYQQNENEDGIGQETKIMNIKPSRKSRVTVGAYLRDPSYVHGVFPEEYYPMETKGNFKFFPPF